jgi:hypothetical protein
VANYSARSAAQGSILVARRAGTHAASVPPPWSGSVTIVNATSPIEHGLTLQSTDGDFATFPNLNWANPLAA